MNISITLAKLARLMNQLPKPDFKDSCCLSNDIFFREKHRDVFLPLKRTDCCWNCACASCAGSLTTSQWRPSEKWRTFNPSSEKKVSPHAIWLNLQRPASAWLCYWGRMLGRMFSFHFSVSLLNLCHLELGHPSLQRCHFCRIVWRRFALASKALASCTLAGIPSA